MDVNNVCALTCNGHARINLNFKVENSASRRCPSESRLLAPGADGDVRGAAVAPVDVGERLPLPLQLQEGHVHGHRAVATGGILHALDPAHVAT